MARAGGTAGFALAAAAALGLAAALAAAGALRPARTTAAVAVHAVDAAQAAAAAEAGIWRAAQALAAGPRGGGGGLEQPWRFGGAEVAVRVASGQSLVDLNGADAGALAAAAAAAGAPDPAAFADAVLARRAALAAAGVSWRLSPRAFDSIAEARALAPAEVWPRLAPRLTVGADADVGDAVLHRLEALARTASGAQARLAVTLAVDPGGNPVLRVLEWRPGG